MLEFVRRIAQRRGFDIVRYPVHTTLPGHLRWLFRQLEISTVLDIGANHGQFGTMLRNEAGFRGTIESFEAAPATFSSLQAVVASDPAWNAHEVALGDEIGEATLNLFASDDWNSLHLPDRAALDTSGRSLEVTGTATCQLDRLDRRWDGLVPDGARVFLKSDTQGHDLAVLAGAGEHLATVEGLLVEASVLPFYDGEPAITDVLTHLRDLGFAPTGIFPVARRKGGTQLETVDLCVVRDRPHS